MNLVGQRRVQLKPRGDVVMQADLAVFARDFPEARLVAEVKQTDIAPNADQDPAVQQMARGMWGANCHYGLLVTPVTTYILRDDFTTQGPAAIHITDKVPTQMLLGRV